MKTLIMLRGLPASGKSTKAKELLEKFGRGNAKICNRDLLRLMLDNGAWSGGNEKFVLEIRDTIVGLALAQGKHVIVDDTNLDPKHEPRLQELAKAGGAKFEVIDFTKVSVDECVARDKKRPHYVGEKVIRDMYHKYLAPKVEPPAFDPSLPDVVICDVDGTIAKMNGRGPFEWDKVGLDLPRYEVSTAIFGFRVPVIFLSGRDEVCREETEKWIRSYVGSLDICQLLMRPAGDTRKDSIVKRELYEQHIKGKYNVVAIFDDRAQVCRMWTELGFGDRLFRVGTIDRDDF